ncbi:MAG: F0F1 ATP synthase subunit B [Actinomycetes bacterium]
MAALVTAAPVQAAAEDTQNFLVPNGTFIAEVVAFALLLWAMGRWVLPPLQKAMKERQELIRSQFDEAKEARERLEAAEQEYRELLDQTRAEASRTREEARAEGQAIIAELRSKAEQEAERVRQRGEEQLAAERDQVIAALRAEIGELAVKLAERIVGETLTDEQAQRRVVDRFLADLEAREPQETR